MSLNRNSMSNINLAYQTESHLGNTHFQNSRYPQDSNIIPRNFNQQLLNHVTDGCNNSNLNGPNESNAVFSQLSGETINREGFHNNMVPFFRGQVKQNISSDVHNSRLEAFTGVGEGIRPRKKEVKSFFDISRNMSHPNGTPSFTNNPKIVAEIPGLSAIPDKVSFDSLLLKLTPLTISFSINLFSSKTRVPLCFVIEETTCNVRLFFIANSTERV